MSNRTITNKWFWVSCLNLAMILSYGLYHMYSDYRLYSFSVGTKSCCGYVEPEVYKRPITHALVDWTEPTWKSNEAKTKLWLISDGLVDGEVEFWTSWEAHEFNADMLGTSQKATPKPMNSLDQSILIVLGLCLIVALVGIWNNWIFLGSDGFSPKRRPSLLQFYQTALLNAFRLVTLRRPLSFKERYPELNLM